MTKRMLSMVIGLSVCGAALAQNVPTTAQPSNATEMTTTTVTWTAHPPSGALSEDAIKTAIANDGYKEVKDLKYKDGVWRTEARGGNKQWVTLAVGPVNGKVYVTNAPSQLNEDEVKAKVTAAGYQDVHDVDFKGGLWNVEAKTAHDMDVDLLIDPDDGSVVAKSRD